MFAMPLDFEEIKSIENMSMGMTYRTHRGPARYLVDLGHISVEKSIY